MQLSIEKQDTNVGKGKIYGQFKKTGKTSETDLRSRAKSEEVGS